MKENKFKTPIKRNNLKINKEDNTNLDLKTPLTLLPNTKHNNTLKTPSSKVIKNSSSTNYLKKKDSKSNTIKKTIKYKKVHCAAFLDETASKNQYNDQELLDELMKDGVDPVSGITYEEICKNKEDEELKKFSEFLHKLVKINRISDYIQNESLQIIDDDSEKLHPLLLFDEFEYNDDVDVITDILGPVDDIILPNLEC